MAWDDVAFPDFSDLIAKFRGGENWPQTKATVYSRERISSGNRWGGAVTRVTFTYWVNGEIQTARFDATVEGTNLHEGDTFDVHYDPMRPSRHYYAPAAHGGAVVLKGMVIVLALMFGLILFGYLSSRN